LKDQSFPNVHQDHQGLIVLLPFDFLGGKGSVKLQV